MSVDLFSVFNSINDKLWKDHGIITKHLLPVQMLVLQAIYPKEFYNCLQS